jgi:uncharacterized protein
MSACRPIPPAAGVGLSPEHYSRVLENPPAVAWFEVLASRDLGRTPLAGDLATIAAHYPLSLRGANFSLTSASPAEPAHLDGVREWVIALQPDLISDRLSWNAVPGAHDGFPYTDPMLRIVIGNLHRLQNRLQRRLLIENCCLSPWAQSTMSEADFIAELVLRTGCGVLLDLQSLHRRALRAAAPARLVLLDFLDRIAPESIAQIHLTADPQLGVRSHIWDLFEAALAVLGPLPAVVQSNRGPRSFDTLQAEAATVQLTLSQYSRTQRHVRLA